MAHDGENPESEPGHPAHGAGADRRVFKRYRLDRVLGEGGMGVVWLAYDHVLHRPVALKFLAEHLLHDRRAVDRLKQETRSNLKLTHPNIVRIFDFVQDGEGAAIAMEYVDGPSLWALEREKPREIFLWEEVRPWLRDLCSALDYAHREARIVHRDLKPANLILSSRGRLKVTDFGLARGIWRTRGSEPVDPRVVGTDVYMSPQQWTGEKPSVADDIYSLGVTVYELLTGRPPFYEGDVFQQLLAVKPPGMTERLFEFGINDVGIPLVWEETIAACLAKDAGLRPGNINEVADRLELL